MGKYKKIIAVAVLACSSLFFIGFTRGPDIYFLIKKNFTIFSDVYREVSLHYVDEVNPEKLMRKGISAMLESLDPYTVLIDEAEQQQLDALMQGSYGGVGLDVGVRENDIVVIAPMEGYAAYSKGIRSGDIIKAVDGVPVSSMKPQNVRQLTTGEPGSEVSLTIQRYGINHALHFRLTRERVETENVAYSGFVGKDNQVGYIALSRFAKQAGQEVQKTLNDLQSQKELKGLVLDLRNNPGGLLKEAVKTVDAFVPPQQLVVTTRGRQNRDSNKFKTSQAPIAKRLPLVVLQNGGSASASEIVAGALQDMDRAVIMGEQSFGKGLVQTVRSLSYNTAIKLTSARYYIPSGRSIQSVTYSHKGENTPVEKADSTRKSFKTQHGRTVYDGDGITPDISFSLPQPTLLQTSLSQQNMYFQFANKYAANHDSLTVRHTSSTMLSNFKNFTDQKNFTFTSASEKYLAKVDSSLADTWADSDTHLQALQQMIEQKKQQSFRDQKASIKRNIYLEIVSRFEGRKGQRAAALPFDELVNKAALVISDQKKYANILTPAP